jgi:hypothetical protein
MIVLDSSILVGIIKGEPDAGSRGFPICRLHDCNLDAIFASHDAN